MYEEEDAGAIFLTELILSFTKYKILCKWKFISDRLAFLAIDFLDKFNCELRENPQISLIYRWKSIDISFYTWHTQLKTVTEWPNCYYL